MKKPNITPGPWRADTSPQVSGDVYSDHGAIRTFVAVCPDVKPKGREETHKQWRTNAQAIAALPDLLAALEATLERIEAHTETMAETQFSESAWSPLWTQTRQALIKAGYTF